LFGIGLDAYWPQFPGLKERLPGYQRHIHNELTKTGAHVVDAGLVDHVDRSADAARLLAGADVDLIFLYVSTCLSGPRR
jgi:L-arabinose isomerase